MRMSLCGEMYFSIQNKDGNLTEKILVVYFCFWLEIVGCKTLLFTVVWHLCPDMKTRKEKKFIWAFQNNKKSLF